MSSPIYLDNNATTRLAPPVADAIDACRRDGLANPASQHAPGRAARRVLEAARLRIAALLGAKTDGMRADRLVFTSGGTESNALALRGLVGPAPRRLLISSIEHPSVAATAEHLRAAGRAVSRIDVGSNGVLRLDHARRLLDEPGEVGLVSVMLGNNETGVVQPIAELARLCADRGVPLHTDAVQAVGKGEVDFRALGVTALSFTAHKFHGPVGVGGLLVHADAELTPQLQGGFQQAGARPGIEPVDLVVGMRTALELWDAERDERTRRVARLRDRLEAAILDHYPDAVAVGADAERLPHTACLAFPGLDRQALVMALDAAGVACSTGSACASGSSEPSPVLIAMGLPNNVVQGAVRLSLGAETTAQNIDEAVARFERVLGGFRRPDSA